MQGVRFKNIPTDEEGQKNSSVRQTSHRATSSKYSFRKIGLIIIILLLVLIIKKLFTRKRQEWQAEETKDLKEELDDMELEQKVRNLTIAAAAASDYSIPLDPTTRPLILYSYDETPSSRANALFFMQHGLHSQADFIFIINGKSDFDKNIPINIPNIRIVKKGNTCFDLGSVGEVLKQNDYELVRKYKRFILMNSSIRGPFMPTWADGCWSDKYLDQVTDQVKLVGMSYNCHPSYHVQSMIVATDSIGIRILLAGNRTDETLKSDKDYGIPANPSSMNGLSICPSNKFRAVSSEISLTSLLYRASYKVKTFMTAANVPGYYEHCFHNAEPRDWQKVTPYEVLFVKANRNRSFSSDLLERLTKWHNGWGYSSWKACAKKI